MVLRALVFDFDGLIVDTESPAYHAWQELYARLNDPVAVAEDANVGGTVGVAAISDELGLLPAALDAATT